MSFYLGQFPSHRETDFGPTTLILANKTYMLRISHKIYFSKSRTDFDRGISSIDGNVDKQRD